jgi:uncharacterized phage protein (TIGR01671 family)
MNIPKFRAWLKSAEKMIDVHVINFKSGYVFCIGEEVDGINEWDSYSLDGAALMQSTGLTDKNEREMFLDDVLKFDNGELFQVINLDKTARFALQGLQTGKLRWFRADSTYAYNEFEVLPHWFEIIGNIHERNLINV